MSNDQQQDIAGPEVRMAFTVMGVMIAVIVIISLVA
jgi:hypothetical protein